MKDETIAVSLLRQKVLEQLLGPELKKLEFDEAQCQLISKVAKDHASIAKHYHGEEFPELKKLIPPAKKCLDLIVTACFPRGKNIDTKMKFAALKATAKAKKDASEAITYAGICEDLSECKEMRKLEKKE